MTSAQMYQAIVLDHFRNPRNKGRCEQCNARSRDVNTSCGDVIEMGFDIDDGRIKDVKFDGSGCAISLAAASMLTEMVVGKTVREAVAIDKQEVLDALGVPISGIRLKCALLGLKVAKMALVNYESGAS